MIYTVGDEKSYDKELAGHNAGRFVKVGKALASGYPGGFALRTVEGAERLIREYGREGVWAVYAVDADWERDTKPSMQGWWHALQTDALILRKVLAASQPELPEGWAITEDTRVRLIKIQAPTTERANVSAWIASRGGKTTRVAFRKRDDLSVCRISGTIPLE